MHHVQLPPHRASAYTAPATLDDALAVLAELGASARVVAGGTDLMVELDRRVGDNPTLLLDITRIAELARVEVDDTTIRIGAGVTHNRAATHPTVIEEATALAQACLEVGSPALRNRATIAGNVVTASPANDTISALAALDAAVELRTASATRSVPIGDFHTGVRTSVIQPDELVTAITIPRHATDVRSVFVKLGLRRAQAISVVHLALRVDLDDTGIVADAAVALGSVAPTIVRVPDAEDLLRGSRLDDDTVAAAARVASEAVQPIDDLRAPAEYRTELIPTMVTRGLAALRDNTQRIAESPVTLGGPEVVADGVAWASGSDAEIAATINQQPVSAGWQAGSLLDWLREAASTGTKEGCAEGECGACTVQIDGTAVLSCLVPAGRAHGVSITTVEGLQNDGLHPLQQRFVDEAAVQCGYCIPGFLVAGAALCAERPDPDLDDVRLGLSGNLCRCTGYYAIEAAFDQELQR